MVKVAGSAPYTNDMRVKATNGTHAWYNVAVNGRNTGAILPCPKYAKGIIKDGKPMCQMNASHGGHIVPPGGFQVVHRYKTI
eukprot:CAMPEP_0114675198 /NCGR_PEP_ID=MMETSP0191-20121206/47552_1 /TAXON_ID=126664 /ORGANISM="Sorites sp." /LENGTH=81 /DNA_ID=CAMNT_0001944069 /DNA_START=3 /DNA_END=248 /DNA_ORIENTATION=+